MDGYRIERTTDGVGLLDHPYQRGESYSTYPLHEIP